MRAEQPDLFAEALPTPEGFVYAENFLAAAEEAELLRVIKTLPFEEARYKQWSAKRRIVSYGGRYDFSNNELLPAAPIPESLFGLRQRVADWTRMPIADLNHATVAEYRPSTQLGWHRDVPQFESIVGVSLGGAARMRFRRYPHVTGNREATLALDLAPRSVYLIQGAARWGWQHAISPSPGLRYSITFRTRRD
jgi:alkylated DNA repair dioxygenase AlkB